MRQWYTVLRSGIENEAVLSLVTSCLFLTVFMETYKIAKFQPIWIVV